MGATEVQSLRMLHDVEDKLTIVGESDFASQAENVSARRLGMDFQFSGNFLVACAAADQGQNEAIAWAEADEGLGETLDGIIDAGTFGAPSEGHISQICGGPGRAKRPLMVILARKRASCPEVRTLPITLETGRGAL